MNGFLPESSDFGIQTLIFTAQGFVFPSKIPNIAQVGHRIGDRASQGPQSGLNWRKNYIGSVLDGTEEAAARQGEEQNPDPENASEPGCCP